MISKTRIRLVLTKLKVIKRVPKIKFKLSQFMQIEKIKTGTNYLQMMMIILRSKMGKVNKETIR